MKIRTLGIPCLNRGDMLLRCVMSVDHPIELLMVINNGDDRSVEEATKTIAERRIPNAGLFGAIVIERHDRLGFAPSCNRFMRTRPGPWLISANDIQFLPGSVVALDKAVQDNPDASIVCADGYSVFAMTPLGVEKVGFLDENFYPAYYEDADHFRRVRLSGARAVGVPEFRHIHGEAPTWGSSTIHSDRSLLEKNKITMANNLDYYTRKWGGPPGRETFSTPFNRAVPLSHWELDPELRAKNRIW